MRTNGLARDAPNVPKAVPKDAPGFSKDRGPPISDNTRAAGVHKLYGTPCGPA